MRCICKFYSGVLIKSKQSINFCQISNRKNGAPRKTFDLATIPHLVLR